MVLYLKLDQKVWVQGDYTDSANFDLSGTIYDENTFTTTRDISGYSGVFRLINQDGSAMFSSDQNLTLNSDGTFLMKFAEGKTPSTHGMVRVRLRLTDSTNRLTCVGVNGSDELYLEFD